MSDVHANRGNGRDVVLITGSSGLIGTALSRKLSAHFHVMGLDQQPARSGAPIQHVYLDLSSVDSLDTALKFVQATHGTRLASVVHLGGSYDHTGAANRSHDPLTVQGTEALLVALRRFDVEQFVFRSTMLVHAPSEPGVPIDETSALGPKGGYAESKLAAEELVRRLHGDVPIVILRFAGLYDDECHSMPLARQIQRIYEKRLIGHVFPGNPEHGQAMVHLDDAADALAVTVARRSELPAETTLLVGEESITSYAELQRVLGQLIHGAAWDTHAVPSAVAKASAWLQEKLPSNEALIRPWMFHRGDEHYELDTQRARQLLGWSALHRLRASLPRMIELLRAQPQFFYETNELAPPGWVKRTPPRPPGASLPVVGA